jgi:hypothetical protein
LIGHIEDFLAVSGVSFPSEDWSLVLAKGLQAFSNLLEINHLCVVLLTVPVSQDNECDVQQTHFRTSGRMISIVVAHQLHGNETKCFLVIKRSGETLPLYVDKDDTELALKFGIVGGTDNPSFELSLRVGEVPSLQLPDVIKIHPKDGYLTAQFPILPTSNKDFQSQSLREVIASTEEHPREGPFTFTPEFGR